MYLCDDVLLKGRMGPGIIFKEELDTLSKILGSDNPLIEMKDN